MKTGFIARFVSAILTVCMFTAMAADAEKIDLNESINKGKLDWKLERDWGQNKTPAEMIVVEKIGDKGENGIKLSADFTEKGKYAAAVKEFDSLKVKAVKKFSFKLRTDNVRTYTLRIIDASGQYLQRRPMPLLDGEWAEVVVDDKAFAKNEHYKGANDGKIHQPIKSIAISITKGSSEDKKPVIELYDFQAEVEK